MKRTLAQAVRKNRVASMAETGASPDAWAEVLLSTGAQPDPGALADLQAWCRRAAEDGESRRLIESAEQWADHLADKEQALDGAACSGASGLHKATTLEAEQQWMQAQMLDLPPPTPTSGWTLRATLLDLVRYAAVHPHAALDPQEWHDELAQILEQERRARQARGESPHDIQQALAWLKAVVDTQ
jgi:hypothetical protein